MKRKKIRVDLEKLIKSISKCRPYSLTDWKSDPSVMSLYVIFEKEFMNWIKDQGEKPIKCMCEYKRKYFPKKFKEKQEADNGKNK